MHYTKTKADILRMKSREQPPTGLETLLEAAADNALTAAESKNLADRMRKDPACREAYAEQMMLNAMLTTIHEETAATTSAPNVAPGPRRHSPRPCR